MPDKCSYCAALLYSTIRLIDPSLKSYLFEVDDSAYALENIIRCLKKSKSSMHNFMNVLSFKVAKVKSFKSQTS